MLIMVVSSSLMITISSFWTVFVFWVSIIINIKIAFFRFDLWPSDYILTFSFAIIKFIMVWIIYFLTISSIFYKHLITFLSSVIKSKRSLRLSNAFFLKCSHIYYKESTILIPSIETLKLSSISSSYLSYYS